MRITLFAIIFIFMCSVTTVSAGNKFVHAKNKRKATAARTNAHDKGYERGMKQLKDARKYHSKVVKDARKRHSKVMKDHKDRMDKRRKK